MIIQSLRQHQWDSNTRYKGKQKLTKNIFSQKIFFNKTYFNKEIFRQNI
jgi:hypothetical protein